MVRLLLFALIVRQKFFRYLYLELLKLTIMAKKGTPEYEIWKEKFLQKRAATQVNPFEKLQLVTDLVKRLKDSLIEESDLILFMFLSKVDPETLSVSALDSTKIKFKLEDEDFNNLVGFFRTFSKDILRLRLHGMYNFVKVNQAFDTFPADFREKYTKQNFTKKYGFNLDAVIKAQSS